MHRRQKCLHLPCILPLNSLYRAYVLATKFEYTDVYIHVSKFVQEKGRKDTLRKCNTRRLKDLHRGPWCYKDAKYIQSVVRMKVTASMLYTCKDLNLYAHGTDKEDNLDNACRKYEESNVDVIVVNPAQAGCRIDLPAIGLFVLYDRDDLYMSRVPTVFHSFIIHDIIKSNRAITDNGREAVFFCLRLRMPSMAGDNSDLSELSLLTKDVRSV